MGNRKIYRQIAKKHGVSMQEVKTEMQATLNAAWHRRDKTADMTAVQNKVSPNGMAPTTDEFLNYVRKNGLKGL